ncbi:MAG: PepSY domain-containing protein [Actinomycetes bacterium]
MRSGAKTGMAVGAGLVTLVVAGYVGVVLTNAPSGANASTAFTTTDAPAAESSAPAPVVPTQGQFGQAAALAEKQSGGVAIKAEAKNANGVYEVKVALDSQEIEYVVNTTTGQVIETDREVKSPFDD